MNQDNPWLRLAAMPSIRAGSKALVTLGFAG